MTRYKLRQDATKATLGGKEYTVHDGIVDVPDHHEAAHEAARVAGLKAIHKPDQGK